MPVSRRRKGARRNLERRRNAASDQFTRKAARVRRLNQLAALAVCKGEDEIATILAAAAIETAKRK